MYDFATNLIHDRRRETSLARYSNFCIRRGVIAARVVFRGGEEGRRRIVKNCFPLVFLQLSPTRLPTNFRRNHLARSFSFPLIRGARRVVSSFSTKRDIRWRIFLLLCNSCLSLDPLTLFSHHFSYEIIADFHSLSNRRISIFMYRCATRYLRFCFI